MRVSVIIVNWNGRDLLPSCLESLRAQTQPPHEVLVVDNGSTDESVSWLKAQTWDRLRCIFLHENTGFAAGNNAALREAKGDLIALLNNDACADAHWIERALPPFQDPCVGMVACRVLRDPQRHVIDKAGHLIYPDGLNRGRGTGQPDGPPFDRETHVLWPDGCSGFYRKSMLAEIGLFEETFYLYGEDAELGMRAQWAGYGCVYIPSSVAYHRHSSSLGRFSPTKTFYVERNRIWLLLKTFPLALMLMSPAWSLLRFSMNALSMIRGRGSAASFHKQHSAWLLIKTFMAANWHGLRGAPGMLRRRKTLLRRRTSCEMTRMLKRHRISVTELTMVD